LAADGLFRDRGFRINVGGDFFPCFISPDSQRLAGYRGWGYYAGEPALQAVRLESGALPEVVGGPFLDVHLLPRAGHPPQMVVLF